MCVLEASASTSNDGTALQDWRQDRDARLGQCIAQQHVAELLPHGSSGVPSRQDACHNTASAANQVTAVVEELLP